MSFNLSGFPRACHKAELRLLSHRRGASLLHLELDLLRRPVQERRRRPGESVRNGSSVQMNIGITTLMSLALILGLVADSIPKTNNVPLLCTFSGYFSSSAIFVLVNILLVTVAMVAAIVEPVLIHKAVPMLKQHLESRGFRLAGVCYLQHFAWQVRREKVDQQDSFRPF